MAEPLKLMYSGEKLRNLAAVLRSVYPKLDEKKFLAHFKGAAWESAELMQRVDIVARALHAVLPGDYRRNLEILKPVSESLPRGFFPIFLPRYVDVFGQEDHEASMDALGVFTSSSSAEFAIRSFIQSNPAKTMKQMERWSRSRDLHQRRLASEGCRPRLPWGHRLDIFIQDPSPVIRILEKLRNDPELYVRKSVANNLNDISRDHPDLALEIARSWIGQTEASDWVVRHALRTLLRKGDKRALELFGHHKADHLHVASLNLSRKKLAIGEGFRFSFDLVNVSKRTESCRIEYAIDYVKSGGKHFRKVFHLSKAELASGSTAFDRKHAFADLSTRRHYPGEHRLHILVNGEEKASAHFHLTR